MEDAIDALWVSFKNANTAIKEGGALFDEFTNTLERELCSLDLRIASDSKLKNCKHSLWLHGRAHRFYEIKRRRSHYGIVTIGVSFWREEDDLGVSDKEWEGAHSPKVYIGFDCNNLRSKEYWDDWVMYIGGDGSVFNYDEYRISPPHLYAIATESNCGWPVGGSWFFCTPLNAINSSSDVATELVSPFIKLINGKNQDEAFEGCHAYNLTSLK